MDLASFRSLDRQFYSRRSRRRFLSLALASAGLSATGCWPAKAPQPPIRVGVNTWPGYAPLDLATQLQFYGEQQVQRVDYPSSTEVARSLRNNELEVAALTLDEAFLLLEAGVDARVFLVTDFSNGGDVVLAKPTISSLSALKGKRIGVEVNALGAYMLARALEQVGLSFADVSVVSVDLSAHEAAFSQGRVDAVVTFGTVRANLLAKGAKRLFDSSQIPGEIVDVLVARQATIDRSGVALQALLRGWFRALAYLQQSPQDAAEKMAPRQGLSSADFLASLKGLKLPNLDENQRLLSPKNGQLLAAARKLEQVMLKQKLLRRSLNLSSLFTDQLLPQATS